MPSTLWYVHDPMCSWCYAFAPTWGEVTAQLDNAVEVARLLGGLAPDSAVPMPAEMRQRLEATWHRIEQHVPGTRFNFDFWRDCEPRRATYPACRAVIAAREQGAIHDAGMTAAIQRAYYREARNPSDDATLVALAGELGLDQGRFARVLADPQTQDTLAHEVATARRMGVDSFPSLVLAHDQGLWPIPVHYTRPRVILDAIDTILRRPAGRDGGSAAG